jgi:hypothetical protein
VVGVDTGAVDAVVVGDEEFDVAAFGWEFEVFETARATETPVMATSRTTTAITHGVAKGPRVGGAGAAGGP